MFDFGFCLKHKIVKPPDEKSGGFSYIHISTLVTILRFYNKALKMFANKNIYIYLRPNYTPSCTRFSEKVFGDILVEYALVLHRWL
jgi:hypothetical protein